MNIEEKNEVLKRFAKGKENDLMSLYVLEGPTNLKRMLKVNEEQWQVIFDYLVFEHNLIQKMTFYSLEFFLDIFIKYGSSHVREVLEISERKYNQIWRQVFDFVALANDGLYQHVLENREKYLMAYKARGAKFVRVVLGIYGKQYDETWGRVLEVIFQTACEGIVSEKRFDDSLMVFSMMMNGMREQRKLN